MVDKKSNMPDDDVIDIIAFLKTLWSHKISVIVFVIAVTSLMFVKTAFFTEDTYTSYGVLHVSNKNEKLDTDSEIQQSDIETSKKLSSTYMEILKTRVFLRDVSDDINGKYSWEQIGSMIYISTVNDTELLKISVTTNSAEDSFLIAETIMQKAPDKLISVYKSGEVEVVDPPVKPQVPNSKGTLNKTFMGFAIGLFLGVAYVFIYSLLDKKVHGSENLEKRYSISLLGETAQISEDVHSKRKNKKDNDELTDEKNKIINDETDFDTVETYKSIRTNIMFSIPKKETGRVIAVTSASPGEGKTTTAINLAITFAQTGARVILIDCDLRKSRVHRYLQIERQDGVSNVVCGYTELSSAIKKNVRENLDCLTAGEIPPNPAELLETVEFENMIAELKKSYDYIFIDTPPITVVTDAAILMKLCSGAVIVAKQETTTYDLLDSAIEEIKKTNARLLGMIFHGNGEKYKNYSYCRGGKYGYRKSYRYKYDYRYSDEPKANMKEKM